MVDPVTVAAFAGLAFAGGALGAAIGGLNAYALAGVAVVVGELATILRGGVASVGPPDAAALGATGITASVGLGPLFGPHVAFAGGVAAAAYAARRGHVDAEFPYYDAKHVTHALARTPDALVVGGVFGVLGLGLTTASAALGLPWGPLSFAVVVSGLCHRIAFGYPIIGEVDGGILDMSPFSRGERRESLYRIESDGGGDDGSANETESTEGATDEPRYLVEPWLPHQSDWLVAGGVGALAGGLAAVLTYLTGSPLLPFGLAAAGLALFAFDIEPVPVTHHMALPAGIIVVALVGVLNPGAIDGTAYIPPATIAASVTLPFAVGVGAVVGVTSALVGELAQRVLYAHADTHLDPPAVAILVVTFGIAVLDMVGVFTQNVIPAL
ncbi:hypothetical protein [Natronomonas sp. EA1]|uniref:hypothetical protein n=1 Tax=Natronomonas sp. EA1 TaxID=3421655 RepID=UPI003EBCE224